jgi:hypothetical protein
VINQIRAFLLERGLVFAKSPIRLKQALAELLEKEKSMLPVFGRLAKAQPDTELAERGVTTVEHDPDLILFCIERDVRLLRDPDAM